MGIEDKVGDVSLPENAVDIGKKVPQVSIGMPVYNGEPFIREALDSLLAQTLTDFELIISDNASTDGTEAICREYAARDARIRYVRQAENRGPTANFQFVLDEAAGEYFMWGAADDVWDREWIAELLPLTITSQCLVYGRVTTIDGAGKSIPHPANGRNFDYQGTTLVRRMRYFLEPPFQGKANPIYGLMPRKIITREDFSIFESAAYGSDMLFLYNILNKTQIKPITSVFLYKRVHGVCGSVGVILSRNKRKSFIKKLLEYIGKILVSQYEKFVTYSAISSPLERVFIITLLPLALILDAFNSFWFKVDKDVFSTSRQKTRQVL